MLTVCVLCVRFVRTKPQDEGAAKPATGNDLPTPPEGGPRTPPLEDFRVTDVYYEGGGGSDDDDDDMLPETSSPPAVVTTGQPGDTRHLVTEQSV